MAQVSAPYYIPRKSEIDYLTAPERKRARSPYYLDPFFSGVSQLMLTEFREAVILRICSIVADEAGRKAKSANVSTSEYPEGSNGFRLDLVIKVDDTWEAIDNLEYVVLNEILEWARRWSASQWGDYSNRIFHSLVPVHL